MLDSWAVFGDPPELVPCFLFDFITIWQWRTSQLLCGEWHARLMGGLWRSSCHRSSCQVTLPNDQHQLGSLGRSWYVQNRHQSVRAGCQGWRNTAQDGNSLKMFSR